MTTQFEKRLQSELAREAARLVPEHVAIPPLLTPAAGTGSSWLTRWRMPLLAATAVVAVAATVTVTSVLHSNSGPGAAAPASPGTAADDDLVFPAAAGDGDYRTLTDLAAHSTNIVIASSDGARESALTVQEVIAGYGKQPGEQIQVAPIGADTAGRPTFSVPGRYLLFLAPDISGLGPNEAIIAADITYVVVGGAAGLWFTQAAGPAGRFTKTASSASSLPDAVDTANSNLMVGWDADLYLDVALSGTDPRSLPPHYRPIEPPTYTPDVVTNPTAPFMCAGEHTDAAATSPDGLIFGVTSTRVCFTGPPDTATPSGDAPIAAGGPIRALFTAGSGWETQSAGLVDDSITAVRAIRGNDDATDPQDDIPDEYVSLLQVGSYRAFTFDTSTRAIVVYRGDTAVGRQALGLPYIDDPAGGWGADLTVAEPSPDLVNPRSESAAAWTKIDARTLRIFFLGGSPGCYGAAVEVTEQADQIAIALMTGGLPGDGACDSALWPMAIDIPLTEPLGDREVVRADGG